MTLHCIDTVFGNAWGRPSRHEDGKPSGTTEHYWEKIKGEPMWKSLCGIHIDSIHSFLDTPTIELHYESNRQSVDVCSTCLGLFMDDPLRKATGITSPIPDLN